MLVKLIYFKKSGKFYSEGSYESTKEYVHDVYHEVAAMLEEGTLPDLRPGATEFVVLVLPQHPHFTVPQLIGVQ